MSYGYGLQIEDIIKPPPYPIYTKTLESGVVTLEDETLYSGILYRSRSGDVSPLAPGLGECLLWTGEHQTTEENRGYVKIRPVPNEHSVYVYRLLHRLRGGSEDTKWLTHPRCRNRMCIEPEHWAKG